MKRLTLAAGVMLAVSVPAMAHAKPVTPRHARQYTQLYNHVAAKFGHRVPGRNIVRWGFAPGQGVTDAQVVTSMGVLKRMLAPPTADPVTRTGVTVQRLSGASPSTAGAVATATVASATSTGSSLPACTWQPESGGNPSAVNPSSGAGGYYQITPSTWAAYGGSGVPQNAPMSEQTAVAKRIYQAQGLSAWTNC